MRSILLLPLLVLLLLLEAGLRLNAQGDVDEAFQRRPGPGSLPFSLQPSSGEVNSTGQRGPEIPAGGHRILFLGDSQTMGAGVREEETFVRLLERPGRVCINGGVQGYGQPYELIYYYEIGQALEPDETVLCFYTGNDYRDVMVHTFQGGATFQLMAPGRPPDNFPPVHLRDGSDINIHGGSPVVDPISRSSILRPSSEVLAWPMRHSALVRLVRNRSRIAWGRITNDLALADGGSRYHFYELGLMQRLDDPYVRTAAELAGLFFYESRALIPNFRVVIIPSRAQVDSLARARAFADLGLPVPRLYPREASIVAAGACIFFDVPYLDLTAGFDEVQGIWQDDGHLNAVGHALAAALIGDWL